MICAFCSIEIKNSWYNEGMTKDGSKIMCLDCHKVHGTDKGLLKIYCIPNKSKKSWRK